MIVDGEGRIDYLNTSFLSLWSLVDDFTPGNWHELIAVLNAQLADGSARLNESHQIGLSLNLRDGRHLSSSCWNSNDGDGARCQIWQFHEVGAISNLADARLHDFVDVATDYFWETDSDGIFTYVSDRYREVTGVPRSRVLNKTRQQVWSQFARSDSTANEESLSRAETLATDRKPMADILVEWKAPNQRDLILDINGKPIFDEHGNFLGYRGTASDVTEAVRSEEALRDSELRLRNILDASPVGVSVICKETNQRLYVNRAFMEMMGASSPDDLLGSRAKDAWAVVSERDPMARHLANGEGVVDFESRRRRIDGSEFWALMNSRDIDFAGTPARMYWITDITARREMERILRESEKRFRGILENSPIPFSIIATSDRRRRFVNNAFIDLMRADTAEELMAVDARDTWVEQADLDKIDKIINSGDNLNSYECRLRRFNGEEYSALVSSRHVDFGGEAARIYWIIDVTDRIEAEEVVRRSEQRLQAILGASPIGFAVVNRRTRKRMFVNQAMAELMRVGTSEELVAQDVVDSWVYPEELKFAQDLLDAGDELTNYEAQRRRADGTEFVALMNSRNLDFAGEPARVLWLTDITERVDAETALRKSEGRLRDIFESSPVGISVVSEISAERTFINKRMADLFGVYDVDQLLREDMAESWVNESDFLHARETLESGRNLVNFEAVRKQRNGTHFWVLLNSSRIEFEGEPSRVIWHIEINEMKRQQAEFMMAKEEADTANRAKSEFLSSMSHELRTPLNAILGFGQLLKIDGEAPLNHRQAVNVDQILQGGSYLLELIDQVLDLAKIEAGTMNLEIERVATSSLLAECGRMVRAMAEERNVNVEIEETADRAFPDVLADRTAFRQVVLNMLSNAVKYNHLEGEVTVSHEVIDDSILRLTVEDTGIGIAADKWPDVFAPFSRLGAEATDIEGTGIGLTLSKELVEQMGGRIGFTSEPGVGSRFWVELALAHSSSVTRIPEETEAAKSVSLSDTSMPADPELQALVLCVEDNLANLKVIELIFEHLDGFELISAPNAEVGLEMAEKDQPDAILMDIRLPGMDGYEALRLLNANEVTEHIPVIAVSADAMPADIKRGIAAGFFEYLAKPVNVAQMISVLSAALNDHQTGQG